MTNAESGSSGFKSSGFDSVFVAGSELSFSVIRSNRIGPGFFVGVPHVKVIMAAATAVHTNQQDLGGWGL